MKIRSKKIKIIYILSNKLIIFSFAFFLVFFFQVKFVDAACSWCDEALNICGGMGSKYTVKSGDDKCDSAQRPASNTVYCYCESVAPVAPVAPPTDMPNLKMPVLQISIPSLTFTKSEAINCTDTNGKKTCNIPWIGEYIAGIYKYAIGIVGILAAVVLMVGGVIWIVAGGSATMIGEAKAWISAALTGLVIALCSYLILYQVNPALTIFGPLGISIVTAPPTTATTTAAMAASGACQAENFIGTCFENNPKAACICQQESAGNPTIESGTDHCIDGTAWSIGLWQINMMDSTGGASQCGGAGSTGGILSGGNTPLSQAGGKSCLDSNTTLGCCLERKTGSNGINYCSIRNCIKQDAGLYDQCSAYLKNPVNSTQIACNLYNSGGWTPWSNSASLCQ